MLLSAASNLTSQFPGKERDAETGLDYFMARYFSSAQGRFTSPDPLLASARLTDPQSWNRYAYVRNDPVNRIDPDGRDWWLTWDFPWNFANNEFLYLQSQYGTQAAISMLANLPGMNFLGYLFQNDEDYYRAYGFIYYANPGGSTGGYSGTSGGISSSLDSRTQAALDKARKYVGCEACNTFLTNVINNLGLTNVTPEGLVTMLSQPGVIVDNHHKSQRGAVVYEEDGRIYIAADGGYTSNLWASLLHEVFHFLPGVGNTELERAMAKANVYGQVPFIANDITAYVSGNCLPERTRPSSTQPRNRR